jgi:hypothetical protein
VSTVKHYLPHIILFCVFLAALIPVLYYYQRRNPNPHFRPRAGEMLLLFVFAMALGGPLCYFMGNVFKGGVNTKDLTKKPDEGAGWSKDTTSIKDDDDDDRGRKRKRQDD